MTLLALFLANSPWKDFYKHIFEQKIGFYFGKWEFGLSLHHWINEGLMTFFFFLIGLEIKREVINGELADLRAAFLPIAAAVGGMLFPAGIYIFLNWHASTIKGWGIPMATDIAFALSVLVILGPRVPSSLLTFLIALAIVDDLGAVLVIALFYTSSINWIALEGALFTWFLLFFLNRAGIHHVLPYFLGGALIWAFLLASGVHATVAGVLTAFVVPSRPKIIPAHFDEVLKGFLGLLKETGPDPRMLTANQEMVVQAVRAATLNVQPPSLRLEHALHLPVALIVIPLFALGNAGVRVEPSSFLGLWHDPMSLGIILGLLLGKPLGIAGTAFLVSYFGFAPLPNQARPSQLWGVGLLGGIGFTMSIFIAELAWSGQPVLLEKAKAAILTASFLAGILGYIWLRVASNAKAA